jgi:general secretion pathway protein G
MRRLGFTLIELLVVLAVVALMLSIALPRYMTVVDRAKDTALVESLRVMRTSMDRFKADRGRWPQSIDELVASRYLAAIPVDPLTASDTTWNVISSTDDDGSGISDIKSGAPGADRDGKAYSSY